MIKQWEREIPAHGLTWQPRAGAAGMGSGPSLWQIAAFFLLVLLWWEMRFLLFTLLRC